SDDIAHLGLPGRERGDWIAPNRFGPRNEVLDEMRLREIGRGAPGQDRDQGKESDAHGSTEFRGSTQCAASGAAPGRPEHAARVQRTAEHPRHPGEADQMILALTQPMYSAKQSMSAMIRRIP